MLFELCETGDDARIEEGFLFQCGLVDYNFDAFGLDALHDALNAGGAEVVRARFHHEAVDANDFGLAFNDVEGNEVLACGVGFDNGIDEILRHFAVVGQ